VNSTVTTSVWRRLRGDRSYAEERCLPVRTGVASIVCAALSSGSQVRQCSIATPVLVSGVGPEGAAAWCPVRRPETDRRMSHSRNCGSWPTSDLRFLPQKRSSINRGARASLRATGSSLACRGNGRRECTRKHNFHHPSRKCGNGASGVPVKPPAAGFRVLKGTRDHYFGVSRSVNWKRVTNKTPHELTESAHLSARRSDPVTTQRSL